MVAQRTIDPWQGAIGALLASLASVLINVPFMLRARNAELTRRLTVAMTAVALCGAAGMVAWALAGRSIVSLMEGRISG
jgi:hypothetical protein